MEISSKISDLKHEFANKRKFTITDLAHFFKMERPEISRTTLHWKIHALREGGVISSLGRGVYQWGEKPAKAHFVGKLTVSQRALYTKIKAKFPLANLCIWPVRWLHEFMTHLPAVNWTFVEVEKDLSESVFALLREQRNDVYLNPDQTVMEHHVAYDRNAIIVRDLISQSPLIQFKDIFHPSLEKMLIDLFIDKVVFDAYQGTELRNIFSEANRKYLLNYSRMKRYATRRHSWEMISNFIDEST